MGSPAPIRLFVGLANPGPEYVETRHNAGAWFIDALAQQFKVVLRPAPKFHGLHAISGGCHVLIPTTYMNCSGRSLQALMHFYKIPPEAVLVAHDELDLPVAGVRLKFGGGAGGHNGLADIFSVLNTRDFMRLRIGIGRPTHTKAVTNYVLSPPNREDRLAIDERIQAALTQIPKLINGDFNSAMQYLHSGKKTDV